MKNQELFDRTISILVKAYFNDTLEYSDCAACAVGNILADCNGTTVVKDEFGSFIWSDNDRWIPWGNVIRVGEGLLYSGYPTHIANKMKKSGYSLNELTAIEYAFYNGVRYVPIETPKQEENFIGLMSVLDALMKIHEANETEIQQAKSLFTKELAV